MRALVTGASGFVGKFLVEHLVAEKDQVLGTTLTSAAAGLPCETVRLDITDAVATAQIVSAYKPEVIYHLAGQAFVPEAENDFGRAISTNVAGTNNVFRVAHLMQQKIKLLLVSSAEVYGKVTARELPLNEQTPLRPQNNYSLSKGMAEMVAERYARHGHIEAVIVRPFNHIGPGQNNRFVASSFAHQLALIARGKSPPVITVGNLDARRDFTDARDIVRGYRLAMIKGQGTYNFGSGHSLPIRELLQCLIQACGLDVRIEQDPARMRPSEIPEVYGSIEKAKRDLGWEPKCSINDTLREIYEYWRDRV